MAKKTFGLKIPNLDLVCIGWVFWIDEELDLIIWFSSLTWFSYCKILGSSIVLVLASCNALFSIDALAKDDYETIVLGKITIIEVKESFGEGTCHILKIVDPFMVVKTKSVVPNLLTWKLVAKGKQSSSNETLLAM